jgi:hypothetical protein
MDVKQNIWDPVLSFCEYNNGPRQFLRMRGICQPAVNSSRTLPHLFTSQFLRMRGVCHPAVNSSRTLPHLFTKMME